MDDMDMTNIVVPVHDTRDTDWLVEQTARLYRQIGARVHLLNVQASLPKHVSRFFSNAQLSAFHQENGMRILDAVMRKLDAAGVPYKAHVRVGLQAETIVRFATEYDCRRIVMEERAESWISALGLGSINAQVRHLTRTHHLGVSLGGA